MNASSFDSLSVDELATMFVDVSLQRSRLEISPDGEGSDRRALKQMAHFLDGLIRHVRGNSLFLRAAMTRMREETLDHADFPRGPLTDSLYRAFDRMDEVLGIQYGLDRGMPSDPAQRERLYEGAGIGVQTSYSTILLALDHVNARQGAKILDLGSGYGRVGFVIGLLRPDISFGGYEYVDHRVKDSIDVASRAGLSRIQFFTQDLSREDFKIPEADIYYMYDPFSRETYGYVLDQLLSLGCTRAITIITKGRANTWVEDAVRDRGWSIESCDDGLIMFFHSPVS